MRVTIICPNDHIDGVRERAKLLVDSHLALTTPLSYNGEFPVTHWMCTCYLTGDGFNRLNELSEYSSIYIGSPKMILNTINLKRVYE